MPILTPAELDSVLATVESHLPPGDLVRLEDRNGQPLQGVERHLQLLLSVRKGGGPAALLASASLFQQLQDALPARIKDQLLATGDRLGPLQKRSLLVAVINASVRVELEQLIRQLSPTPDRLQKFYEEKLSAEERENLLGLSAQEFQRELSRLYYRQGLLARVDIDPEQLRQLLTPRPAGVEGGPPGEGLFRPRPGERRPPGLLGNELPRGGEARFPAGDRGQPPGERPPPRDGQDVRPGGDRDLDAARPRASEKFPPRGEPPPEQPPR
jgi:hypothetical protein